jgi:hypothetical protein
MVVCKSFVARRKRATTEGSALTTRPFAALKMDEGWEGGAGVMIVFWLVFRVLCLTTEWKGCVEEC